MIDLMPIDPPTFPEGTIHVVSTSSGAGSAVTGKRVAETYGPENVVLLFADVGEDADNYRFLRETVDWIGPRDLVVLGSGGRAIWEEFRRQRFLGNTRVDTCSKYLKRVPMRKWLEAERDPALTVLHLGFDVDEGHRVDRARPYWEGWQVEAPLTWEAPMFKEDALAVLAAAGIAPPLLTRQGFAHANCGGGCVKAGQAQFVHLLKVRPQVYAQWEHEEAAFQEFIGKPVTILRDRRGGTTKPMSLRTFRERLGVDPTDYDPTDAGSCNCMGNWDPEVGPDEMA